MATKSTRGKFTKTNAATEPVAEHVEHVEHVAEQAGPTITEEFIRDFVKSKAAAAAGFATKKSMPNAPYQPESSFITITKALFGWDNLCSVKRNLIAITLGLATAVGFGWVVGELTGYLLVAALSLTGVGLLGQITVVLGIIIACIVAWRYGGRIGNAVTRAVQTGDFENLLPSGLSVVRGWFSSKEAAA